MTGQVGDTGRSIDDLCPLGRRGSGRSTREGAVVNIVRLIQTRVAPTEASKRILPGRVVPGGPGALPPQGSHSPDHERAPCVKGLPTDFGVGQPRAVSLQVDASCATERQGGLHQRKHRRLPPSPQPFSPVSL